MALTLTQCVEKVFTSVFEYPTVVQASIRNLVIELVPFVSINSFARYPRKVALAMVNDYSPIVFI